MSMSFTSNAWRRPPYVTTIADPRLNAETLHAAVAPPYVHDPIYHDGLLVADPHIPAMHTNDRHADVVRRIWVPARLWELGVVVGAARGLVADTPVINIPDGAGEQILAFMRTPVGADQETIALRLYLATDTANIGAGICQMVSEMTGYVEGDFVTATGGGISQDIDMPNSGAGISILVISQELAYTPPGAFPVGGYDYFALMIVRRGDLPGDTYVGDVNVIAMEVGFGFES